MSTSHYDDEDDVKSDFSYVQSDVLPTPNMPHPNFSKPDDIGSASQYSEDESHYSSHYSLGSWKMGPPPKVKSGSARDSTRDNTRDSYMSSFSEYSGHVNHLAQPVSVKVVNEPVEPTVNRSLSSKRYNAKSYPAATTSEASSTTPQKLDTYQVSDNSKLEPDLQYHTSVQSSIPPRSSRRPKSEVVDTRDLTQAIEEYKLRDLPAFPQEQPKNLQDQPKNQPKHGHSQSQQLPHSHTPKKGHKKRFSLAISDDLDKLMERANSMKLKTYTFNQLPKSDDSSIGLKGSEDIKKSTDSFKTASLHGESEDERPLNVSKRTISSGLPPRPSSNDLQKARQASNQISKTKLQMSKSNSSFEQPLPQPPMSYNNSDDESHYSDEGLLNDDKDRGSVNTKNSQDSRVGLGVGIAATGVAVDAGTVEMTDAMSPRKSIKLSPRFDNASSFNSPNLENSLKFTQPIDRPQLEQLPKNFDKSESPNDYSGDYSPKGQYSPKQFSNQVYDDENNSSQYNDEPYQGGEELAGDQAVYAGQGAYPMDQYESRFADDEAMRPTSAIEGSPGKNQFPNDPTPSSKEIQSEFKTPENNLLKPQQVPPPINPLHQPHLSHDDKDFNLEDQYYDIDEPVVATKPGRAKSVKDSTKHPKKMKRKPSKKKSTKRESSGQLKPFSYHTLINLLESINGTIIGEEFNQLNLPIREKQLIEKIVDQLSRLTLDMVLDEQRYDIGIDRLERALKVLEGFM